MGIWFSSISKFDHGIVSNDEFIALVTIELQGKEEMDGLSWEIIGTNCRSSNRISSSANKLQTTNCELLAGQTYTLSCKSSGDGWESNHLVIENSKYCEYSQAETTANITITGQL